MKSVLLAMGLRRRGSAVLISCLLHGMALGLLANLAFTHRSLEMVTVLSSVIEPLPMADPELQLSFEPIADRETRPDAGGAGAPDVLVAELLDSVGTSTSLGQVHFSVSLTTGGEGIPAQRQVGSGKLNLGGHGTGTGSGIGPGNGPGFFGIIPSLTGNVVFVVDNSRSMNHPHDSPFKTRFRRVKFELLKSISEMQPTQRFYVVFFSHETTPMPARTLQSARPGHREPFMRWIGEAPPSGGPTDPRQALQLALQLQPDVICFLTDGEFPPGIARQLSRLQQDRTAIHTFAFGDTLGEETLKALAEHNRGEYRLVP
jgi:hypothetical protein